MSDIRHWAGDRYWTEALEQFSEWHRTGREQVTLDLQAIARVAHQSDGPAYRLMEAMASVREHEAADGFRGAPRVLLALLVRLEELSRQLEPAIPAVRILPMSSSEFPDASVEEVQANFFLRDLPSPERGGRYHFRSRGLDAEPGTVVLFQFHNQVIASAVLERTERTSPPAGEYGGFLVVDTASIKTFAPVGPEVLREVWSGEFDAFSNAKQSLSPSSLPAFERRLTGIRTPGG